MNATPPIPPPPTHNAITTVSPTSGALIGTAGGLVLANALHIVDPVQQGAVVTLVSGVITALFHFLSQKFGVNL